MKVYKPKGAKTWFINFDYPTRSIELHFHDLVSLRNLIDYALCTGGDDDKPVIHGFTDCQITDKQEGFQCLQCGRDCCDCFGQDDMYFDYCDDCVSKGIPTDYRPGDEDVAGINTKFRMECV